ncbi:MAG: glycosyltransferase family 4 protein, partial [Armatimonadetes bacterium]|nr:glycosyltransferase family 4 protein [Armatimonadota bacterium]
LQNYLNVKAEKIQVIYPGIDTQFYPLNFSLEKKTFLLKKYSQEGAPFIFWIGSIEKRKNITGLIKAFKILKEEEKIPHKLILGGAAANNKEELKAIKKLGLEYEVIFLENINDLKLLELYNLADLFIFPSFYEGFGLPVLEAFACGTPVALADSSSLPEVAKDAALYFNPEDTYEIARACAKILKDKSIQEKLRNLGFKRVLDFSWRKSIDKLLVFFNTLL